MIQLDKAQAHRGMPMDEYIATCVMPCTCELGLEVKPMIEEEQAVWGNKARG